MEHIEQAGVHSGDSACCLPPHSLDLDVQEELSRQVKQMARGLNVIGLMNTQFAIQGKDIYVLEVNPRASRTVPFVSKATSTSLARIAAKCMVGESLSSQGLTKISEPEYYSVKEAVFPFIKFPGVDSLLGPEMKSTGEVMGVGKSFGEAFAKSQLAAGEVIPVAGNVFISIRDSDKQGAITLAKDLADLGFKLIATHGTAEDRNRDKNSSS
jgi:carbamoyl-phosphate synthase large subunit